MHNPIQFGTSGYRGIIGTTFTHDHVKAIAFGIASLFQNPSSATLIIGFDPRLGNDITCSEPSFTHTVIDTLNTYGIHTVSVKSFVPTPVISWLIQHNAYDGGIILTASHNPPNYNGIKYNPNNGAPAPKIITERIETEANTIYKKPLPSSTKPRGTHTFINTPFDAFAEHLKTVIHRLSLPIPSQFSKPLHIDIKHGSCAETWEAISKAFNLPIKLYHKNPDSSFGSVEPNPTKYSSLTHPPKHAYFMAANDPDGDRHAVIDDTGNPLSPEELTIIIAELLSKKTNCSISGISSTIASSKLIQDSCSTLNIAYNETAVGFKYFTPFLETAKQSNTCHLAVESSGGFSVSFHTLEKCGFLPILLLTIVLESNSLTLSELKTSILNQYPTYHFVESEYIFNPSQQSAIRHFLETATYQSVNSSLNTSFDTANKINGLKLSNASGWLLCRLSGTEPVARIYSEFTSRSDSEHINETFLTLLKSL